MGFDLRRRSELPLECFSLRRSIKHVIVVSTWFSLPSSFFLGYNGGNLQYGSPSFYLSKEISLQTLLSRFLAGPLGYWVATVRPPGKIFFSLVGPNGMPRACLRRHLRETSRNGPPRGIIFAVKDILSKYELNEGQNN